MQRTPQRAFKVPEASAGTVVDLELFWAGEPDPSLARSLLPLPPSARLRLAPAKRQAGTGGEQRRKKGEREEADEMEGGASFPTQNRHGCQQHFSADDMIQATLCQPSDWLPSSVCLRAGTQSWQSIWWQPASLGTRFSPLRQTGSKCLVFDRAIRWFLQKNPDSGCMLRETAIVSSTANRHVHNTAGNHPPGPSPDGSVIASPGEHMAL